jgi:hypothetical protein
MLKREKPTLGPARFKTKSMSSMISCIMETVHNNKILSEEELTLPEIGDFVRSPSGKLTKKAVDAIKGQVAPFTKERRKEPLQIETPGQGGGGFETSDSMPSRGFGGPPGGKFEKLGTGALYTTALPLAMWRQGTIAQQADYEAYRRVGPIGQMALGAILSGTHSGFLAPFISGGINQVSGADSINPSDLDIDPTLEDESTKAAEAAASQVEYDDDEPADPRSGDPRSDDPRSGEPSGGKPENPTTGLNTSRLPSFLKLPSPNKPEPFVSYAKKITRSNRPTMQA